MAPRTVHGNPESDPELRLGISSCLLGEEVRYHGGHCRDGFLVQTLGRHVRWFPLCPEMEIGLGTPRETLRLIGEARTPRLVAPASGSDHTEAMTLWADRQLDRIDTWGLHGFVLKKSSPSCGLFSVKVYDDSGMPSAEGRGIFACALTERFPLLPVEEEGRLHDPRLRENFIERIFAYERWLRFLERGPTPGGLVRFHTAHKLTVLAHSPEHYAMLGRLVAKAGTGPWERLVDDYGCGLSAALRIQATRGRHANVMHHLLGFFTGALDAADKAELLGLVEDYRRNLVPLLVPLTLIKHHLRRHPVPDWIDQQVYLNPYPRELMLRNHL